MIALISSKNQISNLRAYFVKFNQNFFELTVICFYNNLIEPTKKQLNPKKVIYIKVSHFDSLLKYFIFFIKTFHLLFNKEKQLIIGDTMARYKHYLMYLINPSEVIAIDDGIKSVYSFNEDLNFCLPKKYFNRLSFVFTNYNLDFKKINFYINTYKKKSKKKIDDDIVWFIGQPLIVDKRLTTNQLQKYFKFISKKFKNKKIIYFRHPRELHSYKYSGFKISDRSKHSFENFFDNTNYHPKNILTFYSTSIDYCKRSSNSEINYYYYKINVDDRVKAIYNYLDKIGIEKIN